MKMYKNPKEKLKINDIYNGSKSDVNFFKRFAVYPRVTSNPNDINNNAFIKYYFPTFVSEFHGIMFI